MSDHQPRTPADLVIEAIAQAGSEIVFGLAGSHVLPIFDRLAASPHLRFVSVKHENTAAVMAGMYGFLTSRPGVAVVTAGPGAAHCASGVALAHASSHPMVLISGGVPTGSVNGAYHGVDREGFLQQMFLPITKYAARVQRSDELSQTLTRAFSMASSGRPGPVYVEIPEDVLRDCELAAHPYSPPAAQLQIPSEQLVEAAQAGLGKACHPMICAGRGVLVQRAGTELLALAEKLSTPILWTTDADGVVADQHPLAVGSFDQWTDNQLAWELMSESDFLLVVGMRSGSLLDQELGKHVPGTTIYVALDEPETFRPPDFAAFSGAADARNFLSLLLAGTSDQQREIDPSALERIADRKRAFQHGLEALLERHRGARPMHFGNVLRELSEHVQQDAMVVAGVGNHSVWARTLFPVRGRESFLATGTWGTMGAELGAGICAKLVHPNRQVVVVTGDGSLLMALSDLATAVEADARILILVLNDSRYGMITALQARQFSRSYGDCITPVDFARLAQSVGAEGVRVDRPEGLQEAVAHSMRLLREKPVVLDAVCSHAFGWAEWEDIIQEGTNRSIATD